MGICYSILYDRAATHGPEKIEQLDDLLGINLEVLDEDGDFASVTDITAWVAATNAKFEGGAG